MREKTRGDEEWRNSTFQTIRETWKKPSSNIFFSIPVSRACETRKRSHVKSTNVTLHSNCRVDLFDSTPNHDQHRFFNLIICKTSVPYCFNILNNLPHLLQTRLDISFSLPWRSSSQTVSGPGLMRIRIIFLIFDVFSSMHTFSVPKIL